MDYKQQEVIDELRRVANLLNVDSLAEREFSQNSNLSLTTIRGRFGSWNRAVEAAGLTPNSPHVSNGKPILTDDELLQEIVRLAAELGKIPTESEMQALGRFSLQPNRSRWGKFSEAKKTAFAEFGIPTGISIVQNLRPVNSNSITRPKASIEIPLKTHPQRKKVQYGEPIDFRGLRHAPVNEQGVVYMFGMVSRELGFLIESLRTAYPDCEGKRCVDEKRQLWEHVLIEFEYRSSNFREHGHNSNECDLIVCWIHDWHDCPLEVLELRSTILLLPTT